MSADDWWEIRDDRIWLKRDPRPGEALPRIERPVKGVPRVGGGSTYAVMSPSGELLAYGATLE